MRKEEQPKYEKRNLERCQILYPYCQKVVRALWGLAESRKEEASPTSKTPQPLLTFHKFEKL
jgi:hypothetical protein